MTGCDFRGISLRSINADGLDFNHCYFRQADLRSVNFSNTSLDGASIHAAKISGAFFPKNIFANEITLSLAHGTWLRRPSK